MKWQRIKTFLVILAILAGIVLFFFRCSPQKRLNRLISHNPELARTDTVFINKVVSVPGFTVDTAFKAPPGADTIIKIVDHYKTRIDTVVIRELKAEIKKSFSNSPALSNPIVFKLPSGGSATLSQSGGLYFLKIKEPEQKINIKTAAAVNTYQVTVKKPWSWFFAGVLIGWVLFLVAIIIYLKARP